MRATSPYGTGATVARMLVCTCGSEVGFRPASSSPQTIVTSVPGALSATSTQPSDSIARSLNE